MDWERTRRCFNSACLHKHCPWVIIIRFDSVQGKHTPSSLPALTRMCAQYFDGGDAWFTPLFKIAVDQTAWSVAWNSLYYVMLGELAVMLQNFCVSL